MQSFFLKNNVYGKEIFFLFVLYLTLIVSFIFGENSTGGAIKDYINQKNASQEFASDFLKTFYKYDTFGTRHSPVLIILLSFLEMFKLSDDLIRLIHLHLSLFLPFVFYKCLTVKFIEVDKKILFFLSSIIFLSPTFRSLAIWPDSRLLGLTLFTLSIYYFLKFEDTKNFKFAIYNVIALAFSAYVSPNFSVFSIFFLLKFTNHLGFFSKKILSIIIINLILALPAFYYIFVLDINFLIQPAAIGIGENEKIIFNNLFNDILITFSIIFFYLIPFIFLKIIRVNDIINIKKILASLVIFSICVFNFDYNYSYSGGGIFFKLSNYIFDNNYIFYFISFFAILIVFSIFSKNYVNFFLFVLIILNNPQYTIYHKYFDPFLFIGFFTIFYLNLDLDRIFHAKNYLLIIFYFLTFLIISNLKSILIV
tara:strand:+ start:59 stop:1327 length:1269 start_codon:yes stop_codon:yes gene_type:complete